MGNRCRLSAYFDGEPSSYYERVPKYPPKHGLPTNNAIDSWPWSSRVCVGGPCALPLVRSCLSRTCGVLDGLAAAAHQNARSYDVSSSQEMSYLAFFFFDNMNIKRSLHIGQSDASTTKLATALALHFELSAVVLVATGYCSMY